MNPTLNTDDTVTETDCVGKTTTIPRVIWVENAFNLLRADMYCLDDGEDTIIPNLRELLDAVEMTDATREAVDTLIDSITDALASHTRDLVAVERIANGT